GRSGSTPGVLVTEHVLPRGEPMNGPPPSWHGRATQATSPGHDRRRPTTSVSRTRPPVRSTARWEIRAATATITSTATTISPAATLICQAGTAPLAIRVGITTTENGGTTDSTRASGAPG